MKSIPRFKTTDSSRTLRWRLAWRELIPAILNAQLPDGRLTLRQQRQRLGRIFWVYVASMFLESSTYNFTSHTQRLLFGSWFLMVVILMNTFVGYMESSLMLKEETDRLDNIEQLALAPEVRPMVFEAAGFLKIIEVTGTI